LLGTSWHEHLKYKVLLPRVLGKVKRKQTWRSGKVMERCGGPRSTASREGCWGWAEAGLLRDPEEKREKNVGLLETQCLHLKG